MDNFLNLPLMDKQKALRHNSQALAFVGDSVHTLYVRHRVTMQNNVKPNKLHLLTTNSVKASEQSHNIANLIDEFDEQELYVFKRARNYKTNNIAKNQSVLDYKRATGFEAVIGYLYLTGQFERLEQLLHKVDKNES